MTKAVADQAPPRIAHRLPLLDGLRGVAALAVLVGHVGPLAGTLRAAPFGFLAVDLFFMMSGFVITRTYEADLVHRLTVGRFMLIRLARLYPTLALSVVLAMVAALWLGSAPSLAQAARHLLLIPDLSAPDLYPLNPVLWSLFFELVLNLCHAAVARYLTTARVQAFTAIFGAGFAVVIWRYHGAGVGWDGATLLLGFVRAGWGYGMGMTIARLAVRPPAIVRWGALAAAVVVLLAPPIGPAAVRVPAMLFVIFPAATTAAAIGATTRADRLLGWLGGISYPLYAVHGPVIVIAAAGAMPHDAAHWSGAVAAAVLLAAMVESLYDAPLRRVLKRTLLRAAPPSR